MPVRAPSLGPVPASQPHATSTAHNERLDRGRVSHRAPSRVSPLELSREARTDVG